MLSSKNNKLGIATRPRQVIREVIKPQVRFQTPLPKNPVAAARAVETKEPAKSERTEVMRTKIREAARQTGKPVMKVYEVKSGDNLGAIAKKFYGPEEGNKRANIVRLFQANRRLLRSADRLAVGQKLIIPALETSTENATDGGIFNSTMFEKVKSIGQRRPVPGAAKPSGVGRYVVREGDSLWKIADAQLGNGSRYTEIAKLNSDMLEDEDSLAMGMRLRLPPIN